MPLDFPLYFALPVILSPFVAWAILVHQAGPTQGKSLMSLVSTHRTFLLVIWEGKTYYLDYTVKDLEESTVEDVCARCSQVTGVPAWSIEFSVGPKGPSLSRDGHEGVVPGGQLIMTGELIKSSDPKEQKTIHDVHAIVNKTYWTVLPFCREYKTLAHEVLISSKDDRLAPGTQEKLGEEHIRASELLLQALLKLDGVECGMGAEMARSERRKAVKQIQNWLTSIDHVKGQLQKRYPKA